MNLPTSLSKFAARSIIYRLVLNALRKDGFFANIVVQREESENTNIPFTGSGYARKILTILHEQTLTNKNEYIELKHLINKLFPTSKSACKTFLDENNEVNLIKISKVLYYMNYYDGRNSNWLQFVDIQYTETDKNILKVNSPEELKILIKNNFNNIKIKITNAGRAYLFFVVYYFEYFACKSIGFKVHAEYFGDIDMPPLLCAIPSLDDITNKDIESLTCVKILKVVSKEAQKCISNMDEDINNQQILFKYKPNSKKLKHKERIINSHRGSIDNFVNCLAHIYGQGDNTPKKVKQLIEEIVNIRELYKL